MLISAHADVDPAIAEHADIYMCRLSAARDSRIYFGDPALLKREYPGDCIYNAACIGKYIICGRTASKALIEASGLQRVSVKQGYTKCNLLVVDERHAITEDEGLFRALSELSDIECLKISPRQVKLPGYEHGFIGGCTGRIGDEIVFNGDLSAHSDCRRITEFIEDCGLKAVFFRDYPLTDIGSIISE